jgi:hypothetical protein
MGKDAPGYFVTFAAMTLLLIFTAWLILVTFFVALCRMAAFGDGAEHTPAEPIASTPRVVAEGLVVWEEPCDIDLELRDLRVRARGARARAGQYAAGS